MKPLRIPVSLGELIDKITILAIKAERLSEPAAANVRQELALLEAVLEAADLVPDPALVEELREVNCTLWEIEDSIREHERQGDFGADFIALARAVYRTNDRRAALKRCFNERHGSPLIEEKSYSAY